MIRREKRPESPVNAYQTESVNKVLSPLREPEN